MKYCSTWVDGISVLDHPTPTEGYYSFGGFNPQTDPNPWTDGGINAPFDQEVSSTHSCYGMKVIGHEVQVEISIN